jgi:macrodomain Ter protein organizer (MatP/YcbG family)
MQKRRFERWGSCRWWMLLVGSFKVWIRGCTYAQTRGMTSSSSLLNKYKASPRCKVFTGAVCMCDSCADKEEQLTRKQCCDDLEYRCWDGHSQGSKQYQ